MIEYLLPCSLIIGILTAFLIRIALKYSIRRCESKASFRGKVVIVTGGNSGIGYHTAKDLAARGGKVILACRDENRGKAARDKIITETGNKNVVFKQLNLSSLDSVKRFADDVNKNEQSLDVLINNAGVHALGDRFTDDNIIEGMQINHFAPFLLTILLLPKLKESNGRIVILSSICHYLGDVNFEKINKINGYSETSTYANSKLCNLLFTKELARRLRDSKVTVNAVHPGVILTNIMREESSLISTVAFIIWSWFCCRTAEEGAQTVIFLSVAEEVEGITGKYFVDFKEWRVSRKASDETLAKELWQFSEKLVGLSKE